MLQELVRKRFRRPPAASLRAPRSFQVRVPGQAQPATVASLTWVRGLCRCSFQVRPLVSQLSRSASAFLRRVSSTGRGPQAVSPQPRASSSCVTIVRGARAERSVIDGPCRGGDCPLRSPAGAGQERGRLYSRIITSSILNGDRALRAWGGRRRPQEVAGRHRCGRPATVISAEPSIQDDQGVEGRVCSLSPRPRRGEGGHRAR
jgi:hypothetical protein